MVPQDEEVLNMVIQWVGQVAREHLAGDVPIGGESINAGDGR